MHLVIISESMILHNSVYMNTKLGGGDEITSSIDKYATLSWASLLCQLRTCLCTLLLKCVTH